LSSHHPARPLVLASLLVLLVAGTPASGEIHDVAITPSFEFSPKTVTIAVGDTVRWTSGGGHDVQADDDSFESTHSGAPFVFSHTFDSAGTVGYHCTFHGLPGVGMFGTVIVEGGGGGGGGGGNDEPGVLRFSAALYTAGEAAGSAAITVQRTGGDDGAVSVGYSAAAGSAAAGQDFTAVSGTLSWADGDDSPKTFNVPILNDTAVEGLETVALALSAPSGGATLDLAFDTATLRIQDNDQPTGGTPAAPTNLAATASSSSEIALTWQDNATNETGFRVEARRIGGAFEEVATAGANATGVVAAGLDPATLYVFRVQAEGGATASAFSNEVDATTLGLVGACTPGPTALCVNGSRFRVEVKWRAPDGSTGPGQAVPVPTAPDSGLFYFFSASNLELLVKALNACGLNQRYWVFYAATTNVELGLVVTDTQTGSTRGYYNPLNRAAPPVQDTNALATCP
jgi:plastocyanin